MSTKKHLMKKKLLSLAAILAIGFFTSNVEAQTTTVTGKTTATNAGARLIKPMTIENTGDLYFGTISVVAGSGTVTLNPKDAIRTFLGSTANGGVGDAATTPYYAVTGTKNATYAVSLPGNSDVIVTETGDGTTGATMKIVDFTASFGGSDDKKVISTLSSEGLDNFKVGATLEVADGQESGIYEGTFNVSVDYN
jgi:hypothetical protein